MKVLLIHPEDGLLDGPWALARWDRVVDLGRSGLGTYAQASTTFGCPVIPLDALRSGFEEIYRVRDLLACGLGQLVDAHGLDWWELTAIMVHQDLETAVVLHKFVTTLGAQDEVHVSRPSFHARALHEMLGGRLHVIAAQPGSQKRGAGHYGRMLKKLPVRQVVEILWDKTDAGYQLRGRLARAPMPAKDPVVLLPSAYINVTRTGLAYAKTAPDARFLLVATRRSGLVPDLPPNVAARWLKSYAVVQDSRRKAELADLVGQWGTLRKEVERHEELRVLAAAGRFDDFLKRFATGLEIRDAWRNVLDREPVKAVLCADDSNPNTHMPLLLAKNRGFPTVACHHGALDGRYMFKRPHADVVLAKGRMEQDYLVRVCGLPPDAVEVGAPAGAAIVLKREAVAKKSIVFFSETYEIGGGRGRDFYGDVLPRLADLAWRENCELIIKLHPFESLVERKEYAGAFLNSKQAGVVQWLSGPLAPELFENAWFAVTVLSTVAVECALRKVPCFLCKWLECWPYGYVDQFTRFGVGIRLERPEELERIPQILLDRKPSPTKQEDILDALKSERLETLLVVGQRRTGTVSIG